MEEGKDILIAYCIYPHLLTISIVCIKFVCGSIHAGLRYSRTLRGWFILMISWIKSFMTWTSSGEFLLLGLWPKHHSELMGLQFVRAVTFTFHISPIDHLHLEKGNDFLKSVICSSSCFSCPVIEDDGESLKFNSQFESGNLRKAVQVRK